jgi:hypothetical protein
MDLKRFCLDNGDLTTKATKKNHKVHGGVGVNN